MRYGKMLGVLIAGYVCSTVLVEPVFADPYAPLVSLRSHASGAGGFKMLGPDFDGRCGFSVDFAGDVNGDGLDDLVVGDPDGDGSANRAGAAYVLFGRSDRALSSIRLDQLDGTNGFAILGNEFEDIAGHSVAGIGDINHDGYDDVAVGAPFKAASAGTVYVVYGGPGPFPATIAESDLDGTVGFRLVGGREQVGYSVARAGDFNGDGIDDAIIGARFDGAGAAYVLYGRQANFPTLFNIRTLDGTNGLQLRGVASGDQAGWSVGSGDWNGDGLTDVIVGAIHANGLRGAAYVVFGRTSTLQSVLYLSSLNGSNGFTMPGVDASGFCGTSVGTAGDMNGDGIEDVLVGAGNAGGGDHGKAYVVFGAPSPRSSVVQLNRLNGRNGFITRANGRLGESVAGGADINGDGLDDMIAGAPSGDRSYVFYGFSAQFPATIRMEDLVGWDGYYGSAFEGGGGKAGRVGMGGDFDGDGLADFLVGDPNARRGGALYGEAYLVYGDRSCRPGTVNLGAGSRVDALLIDGSNGGPRRTMTVTTWPRLNVTVMQPPAGGSGRFILHGDLGRPSYSTRTVLPHGVGVSCFPFLLTEGANPIVVGNNTARIPEGGTSKFFGMPWEVPALATTTIELPRLSADVTVTFQAAIVDRGSISAERASMTNAITVHVIP